MIRHAVAFLVGGVLPDLSVNYFVLAHLLDCLVEIVKKLVGQLVARIQSTSTNLGAMAATRALIGTKTAPIFRGPRVLPCPREYSHVPRRSWQNGRGISDT